VVRNAHPGQDGDLLATESGNATTAVGAQPRQLRSDPGAAGGEEVADLLLRVHEIQIRPRCRTLGDPASSSIHRDSADGVELNVEQIARLNDLTPAVGERHEEASMAVIDH
jgi:hypothetical protein